MKAKTKVLVASVIVLVGTVLAVCLAGDGWPPWSLGGPWMSTCLGTDGAVIVVYETLIPVDSTGDVLAYRQSYVNADPTVSGLLPESDRFGEFLGTAVRTGPNTYDFTVLGHATKSRQGKRPEILGIVVFSGKITLTSADTRLDTAFVSLYGPDADVNPADGLPDENAKPLLCVGPIEGAARRVGLMPPGTPIP